MILSSYSGDTEETLTCAHARRSSATPSAWRSPAAASSAASTRPRACRSSTLPPGLQPRAAAAAPAGADGRDARPDGRRAAPRLRPGGGARDGRGARSPPSARGARGRERRPSSSPARCLGGRAADLGRRADRRRSPTRWKCQLNENAKMPACRRDAARARPQRDRAASGHAGRAGRRSTQLVMLRDPRHHRQVERRFDLTRELVEPHVASGALDHRRGAGPARPDARPGDARRLRLALPRAAARRRPGPGRADRAAQGAARRDGLREGGGAEG